MGARLEPVKRKGGGPMRKLGVGLCPAVLLLCGCGGKLDERDLVVRNESQTPLGSITITSDRESQCVTMGKDAPMEQGDSCAFDVDEGGQFRVELRDAQGEFVGRCQVELGEDGATVTLRDNLDLVVEHGL